MTDAMPAEDEGGDPPCWAAQFAEEDEEPEGDQDDGRSSRV